MRYPAAGMIAAIMLTSFQAGPAAAADIPTPATVAALIKACPSTAAGINPAALKPDGLSTPQGAARFESWMDEILGDLPAPDFGDATIRLRGTIGSSITQDVRHSTATTLWRDSAGDWQAWRVDHGYPPPPPPPNPPSEVYENPAFLTDGFIMEEIKAPPDHSRRVQRGKLKPSSAAELDKLADEPCFQLETMGYSAPPGDPTMPYCPYDYAGSAIEVTRGGRTLIVTTDCTRQLPSARIAHILFYPDADVPVPEWNRESCAECYRFVPTPEYFRRRETSGDASIDAAIKRVYDAADKGDFVRARKLLEPIASERGSYAARWLLMPELAWLRYKTGDLSGAIDILSVASAVRMAQMGPITCTPRTDLTAYQTTLRWSYGVGRVCRKEIPTDIPATVDQKSIELARGKMNLIEGTLQNKESKRLRAAVQ